ncbi:MAG: hypothetical protein AMJ53_03845 [Gammaproteobacteria bacterium SG8_11]|nr:MAG: hypothetical protein AMJ53_03845 [Gammaproteobacteria bacterium SG8_11]
MSPVHAEVIGPLTPEERALQAYNLRVEAADRNYIVTSDHPNNGDEALEGYINSYTKGLPHNTDGVVDPIAYAALIHALSTGDNADFEAIPATGCSAPYICNGQQKQRNPQAAYSYLMEGGDPHSFSMPAAPAFTSAKQAAEAIEVLWQAITRDIPFTEYDTHPLIQQAADDMSRFSDFDGPKDKITDKVTPGTLFRGVGEGETRGPYISQFLLQPIPFGATTIEQLYNVPVEGNDHLTDYDEWLHIQTGGRPTGITTVKYQNNPLYIHNGRAMAEYVLNDFINQAYLAAARIIRSYGSDVYDKNINGEIFDPYAGSATQTRSPLFGNNHVVDLLSRVSMSSQNVAWFQKWLVHRRARPEVFFGRVHNHLTNPEINYLIHGELFDSPALNIVYKRNGTYLLPTATPVGSPLHPTYPAGHAVMAGAAVTMLKAIFDEEYKLPITVIPSKNGKKLEDYVAPEGEELTIESELNKLASNISLGRDIAGVHYRTDGDLGIVLGEQYAISVLKDLVNTYSEDFEGFKIKKFDGTEEIIRKNH